MAERKIRIAILDDHQIVIDGLKLLLENQKQFSIVGEFTRGQTMFDHLEKINPDILITDILMPEMDGLEVALRMRDQFPAIRVLALSMNGEGNLADNMIEQAQVAGYILKTSNKTELTQAIESIFRGETYFAKEILEELRQFKRMKEENEAMNLTLREVEIIQCIAADLTNKQIADKLFISERTVETHRKNIFRKTNIHSAVGLVDFARKRKLI
ncbi:MAG: response regulator transcription factor [Chitinophagaceae bacterium]|nr:response regulator transcription factor [Chitinophagaceae bacterium]